jgi:hypothetical protein
MRVFIYHCPCPALQDLCRTVYAIQSLHNCVLLLILGNIALLLVLIVSNGLIFIAMCQIVMFQVQIGCCYRANGIHLLSCTLLCDDKGTMPYLVDLLCAAVGGPACQRRAEVLSDGCETRGGCVHHICLSGGHVIRWAWRSLVTSGRSLIMGLWCSVASRRSRSPVLVSRCALAWGVTTVLLSCPLALHLLLRLKGKIQLQDLLIYFTYMYHSFLGT